MEVTLTVKDIRSAGSAASGTTTWTLLISAPNTPTEGQGQLIVPVSATQAAGVKVGQQFTITIPVPAA